MREPWPGFRLVSCRRCDVCLLLSLLVVSVLADVVILLLSLIVCVVYPARAQLELCADCCLCPLQALV